MSLSTSYLDRWRGRVALVTGGTSGIGRAIALELARLGLRVAVVGRRSDAVHATVTAIAEAGGTGLAVVADLLPPTAVDEMFSQVRQAWGGVDVLVNSAGASGPASVLEGDWAEIQTAFDVNVGAALRCMRVAAAQFPDRNGAAIINIGSMTGHRLLPGTPAVYAATKHALRLCTDGVRAELAATGAQIKVALISPGLVDTPWHARPGGVLDRQGAYPYAPLQPEDVARAVRQVLEAPPHVQVGDILLRPVGQPY